MRSRQVGWLTGWRHDNNCNVSGHQLLFDAIIIVVAVVVISIEMNQILFIITIKQHKHSHHLAGNKSHTHTHKHTTLYYSTRAVALPTVTNGNQQLE